jgi:hypothetical protein
VEHEQAQCNDEVIDRSILVGLAIIAQTNGHSVIEEMNIALSAYVTEHLPETLDKAGTSPVHAYAYAEQWND